MNQVLTISDTLYARLEAAAQLYGLSIEQLLEKWAERENELSRRRQIVQQIDQLRERIFVKYGEMPDSLELLWADRGR